VGPIEWLRPYTDDVLPQLGTDGVKNLVVVPISFVSEHIETLEEIDIEYRALAEQNGISSWRRCPALNTDATFINDMADLVVEALESPVQTVTEACVVNNCDIQGEGCGERSDRSYRSGRSDRKNGIVSPPPLPVADMALEERIGLLDQTPAEARSAEMLNGRLAMIGVTGTLLMELLQGKGIMHLFGL
jgi:ferrochelatase